MGIVVAFFQILSLSVCAVLSVQRAFAISGRDWRPASIALALGLVPIGTNIFGYVRSSWSVTTIPIVGSACEEILALLVLGSSYKSTVIILADVWLLDLVIFLCSVLEMFSNSGTFFTHMRYCI
ncbi:hypothetical protein AcV5_003451 [Taiwanofungus camphoratus]|nr:hypothetical protein AcV5_003451 [Antrodia cinnamomea]